MKTVHFTFDESLTALLPRQKRSSELAQRFSGPQSVKHLIESLGIPHTEIGAILSAGHSLSLEYQVRDGDWLEVRSAIPLRQTPARSRGSFWTAT